MASYSLCGTLQRVSTFMVDSVHSGVIDCPQVSTMSIKEQIVSLREQGKSIRTIAAELGVSKSLVGKYCPQVSTSTKVDMSTGCPPSVHGVSTATGGQCPQVSTTPISVHECPPNEVSTNCPPVDTVSTSVHTMDLDPVWDLIGYICDSVSKPKSVPKVPKGIERALKGLPAYKYGATVEDLYCALAAYIDLAVENESKPVLETLNTLVLEQMSER